MGAFFVQYFYKYNMKKYIIILFVLVISSCNNESKITITKIKGSPDYQNSKIALKHMINRSLTKPVLEFSFDVSQYDLGVQTIKEFDYNLANSPKGQHIHLIVNNGPYSAHYEEEFIKDLEDNNNVILAFLSRSYHESVKNLNAFVLTQVSRNEIDLNKEFLFYSRPKGTYKGLDTENILLDFYLVNTEISQNGNKVRATIHDSQFIIDDWAPYYIKGLPMGEIKIKLELIDNLGNLIDSPFNPSERTFILEK
tara:strand:- start:814 stop:1572 length:759 start_codon:yes stop_codon:yes gene_type:complete